MSTQKMHPDEQETSVPLVAQLLAMQLPQWASLPVKPVYSAGTDHALYRLGDEMVVRLPRIGWALRQLDKEQQWLPKLAPRLPLAIPQVLAQGEAGALMLCDLVGRGDERVGATVRTLPMP